MCSPWDWDQATRWFEGATLNQTLLVYFSAERLYLPCVHEDVKLKTAMTVRDGALEIAFKKSAGELGPDFLAEIRNRGGRSWRTLEIKARRRRANFCADMAYRYGRIPNAPPAHSLRPSLPARMYSARKLRPRASQASRRDRVEQQPPGRAMNHATIIAMHAQPHLKDNDLRRSTLSAHLILTSFARDEVTIPAPARPPNPLHTLASPSSQQDRHRGFGAPLAPRAHCVLRPPVSSDQSARAHQREKQDSSFQRPRGRVAAKAAAIVAWQAELQGLVSLAARSC